MPYANNKGADQAAHPRSLISAFVVRCLDSIMPLVSISEISSLYLVSLATQVSLCITWSQTPKTGFLVWERTMTFSKTITIIQNKKKQGYIFWISAAYLYLRPSIKLFAVPLPSRFKPPYLNLFGTSEK